MSITDRHHALNSALIAAATALLLPDSVAAEGDVTTLEEISIEGEVRLPRVLFITSRDITRPLDYLDHYAVDPAAVFGPRPEPAPIAVLPGPLADAGTPGTAAPGIAGAPTDPATTNSPSHRNPAEAGSSEEVQQ
ncbi:MAG: hypothetical protein HKN12_07175 [Gemmatimonadetes bacterium]|nr:hypothetical protein [Gemmatimonadota bacterium]